MPDLKFQITGVDVAARSLAPLLHFHVRVTNSPAQEKIQAILLVAQIQIQSAQRSYNAPEKDKLLELFGPPEAWGQTLRNRLWAHANATVGGFSGSTETLLPVPCTCDLNIAATKYFEALETGEISLLFLFSGSVFYAGGDGALQVSPVSWNQEAAYRMPLETWRALMDRHYPNTGWLPLRRDTFDQLYAFKRRHGLLTWEQTLQRLLATENQAQTTVTDAPEAQETPV